MESAPKKFIDAEEVIRSKNPSLIKLMPGFLLRYIKKIIHEDDLNSFILRHGQKTSFDFVDAIIGEFKINVVVKGEENVFSKGGCIYVSNHPLGGLDAMALMHVLSNHRKDLKFIVNDILLRLDNLKDLFIGVNKLGKNSAENFAAIDEAYASEMAVLIFPAGLVSRKRNGVIKDLEWKKSCVSKSKKYNRPVVPVHIEGNNSNFFYSLSNLRTRLGIKANIEMFYLIDEMYKQAGRTITITFGKTILPEIFSQEFSDAAWAEKIKEHVYLLPQNPNELFKV
jgi:putative hemolysin